MAPSKKRERDTEGQKETPVLKGKKTKKSKQQTDDSCVVYLGHIAHGFYETELRKFFSQFGKVKRLKLFRNKKTLASRGHAFIEFENSSTAETVAEALDGYFLSDRQLVCHVVPTSKHHEGMFLPPKPQATTEESEESAPVGDENEVSEKTISRATRRQKQKQERLKELGIDYVFMK
mmetsp:Transcript_21033/g.30380  ORF Transcript_21033/g.30380 Transcript_21033/m.30380 type:complete len:177 (-) Transcript_21033:78-608(-)